MRHSRDPRRQSIDPLAIRQHHRDLHLAVMRNCGLSVLRLQLHLPHSKRVLLHWRCISVPTVEVASETRLDRIGRPFSVGDGIIWLDVDAKSLVSATEFLQAALVGVDVVDPAFGVGVT